MYCVCGFRLKSQVLTRVLCFKRVIAFSMNGVLRILEPVLNMLFCLELSILVHKNVQMGTFIVIIIVIVINKN